MTAKMWSVAVCYVVFAQIYLVSSQFDKNVGDSCRLNSGGTGVCALFDNCDENLLKNEPGEPVICAWSFDAIVCCPRGNPRVKPKPKPQYKPPQARPQTSTRSKSYQKCKEYSDIRCQITSTHTIIGGDTVESPDEFPHMALLGHGDIADPTWNCGGTLISEQYIITAAHCTTSRDGSEISVAQLGFLNKNNRNQFNSLQQFEIVDIIYHPERDSPKKYHDIVLLKLNRPAKFNKNVVPACLHEEYDINTSTLIATGWGDTKAGSNTGSDELMKVTFALKKHDECSGFYKSNRNLIDGIRDAEQFCAGETNKDTCQGDSGGPLQIYRNDFICMQDIIGITSFGGTCGRQPGVYTRISQYVPWIESVVWP